MNTSAVLAVILALGSGNLPSAQIAGSTRIGLAVKEARAVTVGWSARRQIIGRTVYNESDEKVGRVEDLIIAPSSAVSFAIISTGGFAGLGRHDVAIPVQQIQLRDGKLLLAGATKEAIKALPKFEYEMTK